MIKINVNTTTYELHIDIEFCHLLPRMFYCKLIEIAGVTSCSIYKQYQLFQYWVDFIKHLKAWLSSEATANVYIAQYSSYFVMTRYRSYDSIWLILSKRRFVMWTSYCMMFMSCTELHKQEYWYWIRHLIQHHWQSSRSKKRYFLRKNSPTHFIPCYTDFRLVNYKYILKDGLSGLSETNLFHLQNYMGVL